MAISGIVKKSLIPLIWLSGLCAAVSGFILIDLGVWRALWPYVLAFAASIFVFPILLFPTALFAGLMASYSGHNAHRARIMMACSIGWLILIMSLYMAGALHFIAAGINSPHWLPSGVWGVSAGLMAWLVFAAKDRENIFVTGLVMMLGVASVAAAFLLRVQDLGFFGIFAVIFALTAAMTGLQAAYEKFFLEKKNG